MERLINLDMNTYEWTTQISSFRLIDIDKKKIFIYINRKTDHGFVKLLVMYKKYLYISTEKTIMGFVKLLVTYKGAA